MSAHRAPVRIDSVVPIGGPQLLVLDSGVIYDDIVHGLRHAKETVLVSGARLGATRLFAARHVYDEVYDHLDGHERRGVTRDAVIERFEQQYLPLIRFVEAARSPTHPRAKPVWDADADDGPTAELAMLLAPCVVLAVDPHLVDAGFGRDDWLTHVWSARELLGLDTVLLASGAGLKMIGERVSAGIRWFVDGLTLREVAAGLALGTLVTVLLPAGAHAALDAATSRTVGVAGEIARGSLSAAGQVLRERTERAVDLQAAAVPGDPVPSAQQTLARRLALAGGQLDASLPSGQHLGGNVGVTSEALIIDGQTVSLGAALPPRPC